MDGLARPIGAPVPFEFDGATVLMQPLTLKAMGIVEQYLLSKRGNPIATTIETMAEMDKDVLKPDVREQLMRIAVQESTHLNKVNDYELTNFLGTREGLAFVLWMTLKTDQPGKYSSHLDVLKIVDTMDINDVKALSAAIEQASGVDEMGNSIGQTTESETGLATQDASSPG